ncbi:MAG: type 4a pilus biogenesis protein PilO [Thermoleophilia bacterium]
MSSLLSSPKRKLGAAVAGGLLVLLACWLLVIAPERSKATDLKSQVAIARAELLVRRAAVANPSVAVTVRPADLFRLMKALPNATDMPGILLDLNRLAGRNDLAFDSVTPAPEVLGIGYTKQPLAVILQGRFADVSRFLGELRRLVSVRGGRLDARGRLYSVSRIDLSAPAGAAKFPLVRANVLLNAYAFSAPPATPPGTPGVSPTPDSSSGGTVAAGVTP